MNLRRVLNQNKVVRKKDLEIPKLSLSFYLSNPTCSDHIQQTFFLFALYLRIVYIDKEGFTILELILN